MRNITRRHLFHTTATVGLGATLGTIVSTSFAHEVATPPSTEETLALLSSAMTVNVLVGFLYAAWEISLMIVALRESVDTNNSDEYVDYIARYEYRSNYQNALDVIYALYDNEVRRAIRRDVSEKSELVDLASRRLSRIYGDMVNAAHNIEGIANNQRAIDTLAALYHHERILTINAQETASGERPILCRYFPFSRICDWLDIP